MDQGTINLLLFFGILLYANISVYNWAHTLNPYDFSDKRKK